MSDGYAEVHGDIASQRKIIRERKTQLDKPVVGGTAKQQRVAMRRVKRSPVWTFCFC